MLYLKLGWRNLWRNKRRSAIELSSIAGSVLLAVFYNNFAKGSYAQMIEEAVKLGSGHVGYYQHDYLADRKLEQAFDPAPLLAALAGTPGVASAEARLYAPGLVRSSRDNRPIVMLGVDPEMAVAANPLFREEAYAEGGPLTPGADGERYIPAAIGGKLADDLGLKLGRKFVWMAQGADGEIVTRLMRVQGIFDTGVSDFDDGMVLADRRLAAAALGLPGLAHELAVMLPADDRVAGMLPTLTALAEGTPGVRAYRWQEAMPALSNAIRMDYAGVKIIVGFIYFLVGIGTINTLLMSVMERMREFGVIRSLGLRASGVRRMVLAEALVLSSVGVGLGLLGASLLNVWLMRRGIDFSGMFGDEGVEFAGVLMDPVMYPTWDATGTAIFSGAMLIVALFAALYPAHRALKVRPADAVRRY